MIKRIRKYFILSVVALLATSCLDKYPEDAMLADKAINTVDDANQAVIGIYDAFKSSSLYSGYLTLLPDLQADFVYAVNGYSNTYGDIWRWNDIHPTNAQVESVYGALYGVINRCNFLLDNVEKVKASIKTDEEYDRLDQYCGEAYFARALAYSELVKMYCKPYESDEEAANELGVVLTEHYKGDEPIVRASLKDSYQFILDFQRFNITV